ncbi:Aminotransferase class IV family protein [Aspergillus niger]|uniref:Aminotransferase class IV family protein n=1 Tax=Aspergillus niger TaxID=5061 RepID=A0A505I0B8_ASPNG|nr:Aminotransferase class IV family protein [Aspergillus niger]
MASPPSPWFSFSDGNFMLSNIAGVDPFDETLGSGNTIAPPATVSSSWMPGGIPMSQNGPSYQPVQPVPAMPVENIGSFQQQPNVPYANLGPFQYPLDVLRTQQAQSSSSVSAPVVETTRPAPDFGSPLTVHHDTNMTEEPRYATRDQ